MMRGILISLIALLSIAHWGCSNQISKKLDESYVQEIETWQQNRVKNLTRYDGWTTLVGLYWLNEGNNTLGSARGNHVMLPEGMPEQLGSILWYGKEARFQIEPGIEVTDNGKSVKAGVMQTDRDENTTYLYWKSYQWHLISRDGKFGLRLKDTLNPARLALKQIPHYPINGSWVKQAKYTENDESIILDNKVNMKIEYPIEGTITFKHKGQFYDLLALDGGPDLLFVLISDETTWDETYGGGRYMYVPRADENGDMVIDFNKAFNPPCVFTDFATCLLPPKENALPFKVEAGEKMYGDAHE